jgi:hypothetical protein
MSPAMMIMGVIVIIILYMYFFYKTGETKLTDKIDLSVTQADITIDKIVDPEATVYSFETWVYISKYNGVGAELFSRAATTAGSNANNVNKNISVEVTGSSPTLKVKYMDKESTPGPAQQTIIVTDNFPVQSWAHVVVSIENQYIDIYVNGKLTKSIKAKSIETPSTSSTIKYGLWTTTGGCSLAKFYRRTNAIDPATAWSLYDNGNGNSKVSKYLGTLGMDISLKKDNLEYSKLNIF